MLKNTYQTYALYKLFQRPPQHMILDLHREKQNSHLPAPNIQLPFFKFSWSLFCIILTKNCDKLEGWSLFITRAHSTPFYQIMRFMENFHYGNNSKSQENSIWGDPFFGMKLGVPPHICENTSSGKQDLKFYIFVGKGKLNSSFKWGGELFKSRGKL